VQRRSRRGSLLTLVAVAAGFGLGAPSAGFAQGTTPQLEKSFSPTQVNVGETTTLEFAVTNPTAGVQTWSFTDQLATGLQVARSTPTANTCTGTTVTAPLDGSTIQISGQVPGSGSCAVSMLVMATDTGIHQNAASNITQASNIAPPTGTAQVECDAASDPPVGDIDGVFVDCDFSDEPPANNFTIQENWRSAVTTIPYQTPVVGDLFGTGDPAIVVGGNRAMTGGNPVTSRLANDLKVYDGASGTLLHTITTPRYSWSSFSVAAIADVNADGRGEIIFRAASHSQTQADANAIGVATAAEVNGRLVAYEYDPAGNDWDVLWVSDQRYDHGPGTATVQARGGAGVNLADFNGDGTPEVYVGNQVFNAATGGRLAAGSASESSGCQEPSACFLAQTVAFDADGDGDLELAAGDVLYDVQIANPSGEAGNSMPIVQEADPTVTNARDGFTAVADMDLDGAPEVVVMAASQSSGAPVLYVWDPRTGTVEGTRTGGTNGGTSGGPPMIGDINGDDRPDIVTVFTNRVRAYTFTPGSGLTNLWIITVADSSGGTSMSMFDFNNDGKQEIVYRDEQNIRILDGGPNPSDTTTRDLARFSCGSGTSVDMPVVADIDGSGEARIAVTCASGSSGELRTYETASFDWANTRPVWNQQAYFVTHINDDLTVPTSQLANWTVFNDPDHRCSDGANRPLNAFQVQVTDLDSDTGCAVACVAPALEVRKTSDPPTGAIVRPGDPITYTISIENTINDPIPDVDVTDDLSAVLDDATITSGPTVSPPAAGTAQITGSQLIFNGTIPGDQTVTITYRATVKGPGQLGDADLGNSVIGEFSNCDGSTACTTEHPIAALLLAKAADRSTANVGDAIEYTFTVTNTGSVPLTGVGVDDPLPGLSTPVCQQVDLAPYESTTCTATKTATAGGQMVNTATATGDDPDGGPVTSNPATATVEVIARSDLRLEKTADPVVDPGDAVTWTLTVTNDGPEPSTGSTVTDSLPAGVTNVSTLTPGCIVQGNAVTCDVGPLAVDASRDIVITGNAPQTPSTCFENQASVEGDESDHDPSNDEGSARTCTTPAADLRLEKTADSVVDPGDPITWTLTVTNDGPDASPGATVSDTLPAGVTNVEAPTPGCTVQGNTVTCAVGALASGADAEIVITGNAPDETSTCFENDASVAAAPGAPGDPDLTDNEDSARTCTTPAADLELEKSAATFVEAGAPVTWTLTVTNNGPNESSGSTVTDTLPSGVTNVQTQTQGCTVLGTQVTCAVGPLDASDSTEIVITGNAPQRPGICVENAAAIEGVEGDPELTNNEASVRTCTRGSDLALEKSGPAVAGTGDEVTWTLTVTNEGPDQSTAATVTDTVPAVVTNVQTPTQGCTVTGNSVSCNVDPLADGESTDIVITGNAPQAPGSCFENDASVQSDADPDGSNDADAVETCTPQASDLSLSKAGPATVAPGGQVTWTITVTNDGPGDSEGATVVDPVPAGITGVTSPTAGCELAGGEVRCDVGPLAAGASTEITVAGAAPSAPSTCVDNTATVTAAGDDLNGSNDSDTARSCTSPPPSEPGPPPPAGDSNPGGDEAPVAQPRLRLTKRANRTRVRAGQTIVYTIEVRNPSDVTVRNVRVCDRLPTGLASVRATPRARLSGGAHCWTIKRLAGGASKTFRLTTRALAGASGRVVNTATARSRDARAARARRAVHVQPRRVAAGGVTG
jgi:uncharacterized repeat protein (TIGR01451 family)